ncbi:DUF302 domain-containing protein [Acuticoccus sp.]|uniref:DUF302 domain-containing protein n=1 Tax=Acuticoccus sp. TaxID=1904378 RepID=UPI003B5171FA
MRTPLALAAFLALAGPTLAQSVLGEPDGWRVHPTHKAYDTLLMDLKAEVKAQQFGLVTEAGPTEVAAQRGENIPGNRVVGVFRNDLAVTIIRDVPAAMIEAPVRFMVMEEPDGTGTLAYKMPSSVFAPYEAEGSERLADAVATLDEAFAAIAERATSED